jgi:hypothetical protein
MLLVQRSQVVSRLKFACLLAILLLGFSTPSPAQAQTTPTPQELFFAETGHTIKGDFLVFFLQAEDPMLVYGYPITDAFSDPVYGRLVQYFEKARFELYPDEAPELRVRLTPLGKWLYTPGQVRVLQKNAAGCRTFTETEGNYQVCLSFLDFFTKFGGLKQFGYPISNVEMHGDLFVQYFQKARFEWRPERPAGQFVVVSDLGSIYFAQQALDKNFLRQSNNLPQTILRLKVRAFPERAVTGLQGQQTVYVTVHDQNLIPVAGAQVKLQMYLPTGEEIDLPLEVQTDAKGMARLLLPFKTSQPGIIILRITARLDDLEGGTISSFRAWY